MNDFLFYSYSDCIDIYKMKERPPKRTCTKNVKYRFQETQTFDDEDDEIIPNSPGQELFCSRKARKQPTRKNTDNGLIDDTLSIEVNNDNADSSE